MRDHTFTPPDIAKRWGVKASKIISFITSGELSAFNVASPKSHRPRWRVSAEAVEAFEKSHGAKPPEKKPPRRRREKLPADFVEYV